MLARHLSQHKPRRFVGGAGLALFLAVALAAGVGLARRAVVEPTAPLDPNLPNEQSLIAAGLAGTPGRDQPTRPVAVDRVLVDGAATYVQYHLTAPGALEKGLYPTISDDRGATIGANGLGGYWSSSQAPLGWMIPFALPAWVPWRPPRPPTVWHGYYVIQPPLPATARIAVVQFGGQDLGGVVETVRVPLDLRALALRRIVHPGTRVRASGLTLTLRDLAVAHLTYTLPPDIPIDRAHVHLVDGTGRIVPTTPFEPDCTDGTWGTNGGVCAASVVFPPQRSGVRLTLSITALPVGKRLERGPWRLSFVVP